ncbi:MAG: hypothetical protein KAT90_13325 [Gammaproteobacteria bacterium]|nr:hypothetical protein [Gammaproteobacteria bacterium]
MKSLGQYNAYVASGMNKEEQLKRLNEVPDKYRNDVIRHMRTIRDIKNNAKLLGSK